MIPPDLYGRRRRDPFWVAVSALFGARQRVRYLRPPAVREIRPVDRTMDLVVLEVRPRADGVVSLRLGAPDGRVLPSWQPGCHLDVLLPAGTRQYSLCGDPADRRAYRIAVRRLHGLSAEMHALCEGDVIRVRGPRNAFPFLRGDRYLFIAGGIGITPILPMVTAAERLRADWRLIYCGRGRDSMPFLDELAGERVRIRTDDEHGVPDCGDLLGDPEPGTAVYCCGPAPMIDGVRAAFGSRADATLHYERFAPAPVADGRPFRIELRRSGRVLEVPADRSALDVIKDELPAVAYSCRQGFCGTCRTRVLEGEVERRSPSDGDDGAMLICVSRAADGRLALDL
ncbi:PDR/VanB family oxidoreductase [Spirillospora albida]|uniref:PDR/VanB family oxidoreductase n=1 Tax=Spirillospora albida TaxID=58123 RepID=UPI0004C113F4|nr:PDR/VanB family oxidoreductase [Spirillospora albida]